eukprot:246223-Hanusia_phi.AAC.2
MPAAAVYIHRRGRTGPGTAAPDRDSLRHCARGQHAAILPGTTVRTGTSPGIDGPRIITCP